MGSHTTHQEAKGDQNARYSKHQTNKLTEEDMPVHSFKTLFIDDAVASFYIFDSEALFACLS